MKIYPPSDKVLTGEKEEPAFTVEEIRRGVHWLYADVTCTKCGKVQSLASAGSVDNGQCVKCGGKTI